MADQADETPPIEAVDPEMRQLLGLYDVPAFARRGHELEHALRRLASSCARQRQEMLEMVCLRLKQWSRAVEGPESWVGYFDAPVDGLWTPSGAEPPTWGQQRATPRRRRAIARDLAASVSRFNRRWEAHVRGLNLDAVNVLIDHYNRFYVLEKECVLRSPRLAARLFQPAPRLTADAVLADHPLLPVPVLAG